MIGMLRLGLGLLVVNVAFYFLLLLYFRSRRKMRLEQRWDEAQGPGNREDFIEQGMAGYSTSIKRRLLWLVIVIPYVVIMVLIYVLNFA